jgi:hypothetical protein
MSGLSENPGQVYSIASRCLCMKCGEQPQIQSVKGEDPYTIVVKCHGETESKSVTRRDLVFTQRFFDTGEED